ncbi:uncharacterized protein AMSG_12064 [Thecamonas trahens ATCC 50062]|uniref:Uncharacterized protein n=1 Tax=Thecamonas trahens ATCC 50062 TaxID=461836 RepID=A0A0L0DG38_THETB|nr:hypothetical protein AMSG_12064 [Thecamonas trahens ATCC 50062]KNC51289.1 hypothetical protein AMSG_12064 [Thecamonas trahens ATCC 50062]|eukprot:XP_013756303.1 hypothetical protein AMSG_12064 [Thecamonas trahens ATCC 50062]
MPYRRVDLETSQFGVLHSASSASLPAHAAAPDFSSSDPYRVLGLSPQASPDEVRTAYRRLAMRLHPDRNSDDPAAADKFAKIQAAYDALAHPEKAARRAAPGPDRRASPHHPPPPGDDPFADFVNAMFGGGPAGGRDGGDIAAPLRIAMDMAFRGGRASVAVDRVAVCSVCSGTGAASGNSYRCTACSGTGRATTRRTMGSAVFTSVGPCSACRTAPGRPGVAIPPADVCKSCRGIGRVREQASVPVDLPPGVFSGLTLRVPGQGSGPTGDLYVTVDVETPTGWEIRGADVVVHQRIALVDALTGNFHITIHHPAGHNLRVSAADVRAAGVLAPGAVLRVPGEGMPHLGTPARRGNLYIAFDIAFPPHLDPQAAAALRDLLAAPGPSTYETGPHVHHHPSAADKTIVLDKANVLSNDAAAAEVGRSAAGQRSSRPPPTDDGAPGPGSCSVS